MTIVPPSPNNLLSQVRELLPKAIDTLKQRDKSYGQTVFFNKKPYQCNRLSPLAQTSWDQRSLALREDGVLCMVWGWMDYVNGRPRPSEPTNKREKREWFTRHHAFGEVINDIQKLSHEQLGVLVYELDDIVDPLYSGYGYPIWAVPVVSGIGAAEARIKTAQRNLDKVDAFLSVFGLRKVG